MKVLVIGGTGFTGSYVVSRLLQRNIQVRCLVRSTSDVSSLPVNQIELVYGDLDDQSSVEKALFETDALVNIASLGFGHAPMIVQACLLAGVRRAVFVSTTAIFTSLNAGSKKARVAAEEAIQKSDLVYTIIRPTMIYGSSRDRNMCRLIHYLRRFRIFPIIGTGRNLQQPVYVDDVAGAVVDALLSEKTLNQSYNIAGANSLTFNQVIDTVSALLNRSVYKLHIPVAPVIGGLGMAERLSISLPIKVEQIQRLNEDKVFDYTAAQEDFGYHPRTFHEGISLELHEMGIL